VPTRSDLLPGRCSQSHQCLFALLTNTPAVAAREFTPAPQAHEKKPNTKLVGSSSFGNRVARSDVMARTFVRCQEASMLPWIVGPDLLRAFVLVALGIIVFQQARHRRTAWRRRSDVTPDFTSAHESPAGLALAEPIAPFSTGKIVMQRATVWLVVGVLTVGLLYSFAMEWWPQWTSWQTATRAGNFRWGVTNMTGVVRSFNYGPAGAIDGLLLDSGVIAHFPPEQSNQIASIAPVGALVRVQGWTHFGPAGDRVLDVETITNGYTRASLNIQGPVPLASEPSSPPGQPQSRPPQ
jgi:hypothetical protein